MAGGSSFVLAGSMWFSALFAWPAITWPAIKARIAREFPDVKSVTTTELAARLEGKSAPVLLDVRTPAEFAVSHLTGARRVDPAAKSIDLPKETEIVTYCSVGYRSAKLAQRLQAAGFTKVRNLDGSIFQWANEGRALDLSAKVHPYNKKWGSLLDPAGRADAPDAE